MNLRLVYSREENDTVLALHQSESSVSLASSDSRTSKVVFRSTTQGGGTLSEKRLAIEDVYPDRRPSSSGQLAVASRLVAEALECLEGALNSLHAGDEVDADDGVQQVQSLMPELFSCRGIGDGFGAAINAVLWSLGNKHGEPLDLRQIAAVRRVLKGLHQEPFMSIDVAADAVADLEGVGLDPDPAALGTLADWLDG